MITDVINGSDVLVFLSPSTGATVWKSVAHATSHSLSIKMATRDTSNKGTLSFTTKAAGRLDVSATVEGMCIDTDIYNYADFLAAIIARTPYLMVFGKETSDGSGTPDTTTSGGAHFYASGQFLCTGVDVTAPDEGNMTYTATFEHFSGFAINRLATT
jgi:hypothetical protein